MCLLDGSCHSHLLVLSPLCNPFHLSIISIQSLSCVWLFVTPWTAAHQSSLSFTISQSLLKLICIEFVMTSNHLILCHLFLILPSIFPSIRVFSNESALHIRWPKYWSFSFSISPSSEYSGLISFRMDWLDLLAVQGTLKLVGRLLILVSDCAKTSTAFKAERISLRQKGTSWQ